jgi:hypothetical protein
MIYSETGGGKSSCIAALIAKVFRETGKSFRVYVGDGSAATYEDWGLVDVGAVHLMDYTMRDWPLTTMQQITEGMWPEDPLNPQSKMRRLTAPELAATAGWVYEGTSVASGYIMGNKKGGLAEQAGRGVKIGQDSPIMLKELDTNAQGNYVPGSGPGGTFGGNPISHYNVAQRHMLTNIERSKQLPGLVYWSGHERVGEDAVTSEKVIGPEVAGKALSAGLPKYFNNTLHATVAVKVGTKTADATTGKQVSGVFNEYRLYTRDHMDPDAITPVKYKAVIRTPRPDMIRDYYVSDKPGQNLLDFYADLQKAKEAQIAALSGQPTQGDSK